jgi:ribosomal protein L22
MKALTADLHRAQISFATVKKARRQFRGDPHYLTSLKSLENAAERTIRICKAGIDYRRALHLEKAKNPKADHIIKYLRSALENAEDNYRIVRENNFDLTEEFFLRTRRSVDIVRRRLGNWATVRT